VVALTGAASTGATPRPLAGRAALVTGASRGIGLAAARALAGAGARVALVARSADRLETAARELRDAFGVDAFAAACDVRDVRAASRVAEESAERLGGVDVLVSNAGVFALAPVEATDPADFAAALEANLVAPFVFARALVPAMRARGAGHVVTVGSVADRVAYPENGAYAASKFGVRALHEVLREELRGSGVRATLVSPGPVDTPLWDAVNPDARPGFTPRALMLRPEHVADAILFAVTRPPEMNVDELRLTRS
jgi:NADP-dependent 3-hydroxy acid dehydrogenase YdfG